MQAQHNMLVELTRIPNNQPPPTYARAGQISHEAARCATSAAPEIVKAFREREWIDRKLVSQSRDVGGLVGAEGLAVAREP